MSLVKPTLPIVRRHDNTPFSWKSGGEGGKCVQLPSQGLLDFDHMLVIWAKAAFKVTNQHFQSNRVFAHGVAFKVVVVKSNSTFGLATMEYQN